MRIFVLLVLIPSFVLAYEPDNIEENKIPLLLTLIEENDFEAVTLLISNGVDVNALDSEGRCAVIYASGYSPGFEGFSSFSKNKSEILVALLLAGADPKKKDKLGKTAFDYATVPTKRLLQVYEKKDEADKSKLIEPLCKVIEAFVFPPAYKKVQRLKEYLKKQYPN